MKQQRIRRILTTLAAVGVVAAGTASAYACLLPGIPC